MDDVAQSNHVIPVVASTEGTAGDEAFFPALGYSWKNVPKGGK